MKINTKLNIILVLFFILFVFGYYAILEANSVITRAEVRIGQVEAIGSQMNWFVNKNLDCQVMGYVKNGTQV